MSLTILGIISVIGRVLLVVDYSATWHTFQPMLEK